MRRGKRPLLPIPNRVCALAGALTLASCNAATDLVAQSIAPGCRADAPECPDDQTGASCKAATCAALDTRDLLCRSTGPLVQAGDSCGAGAVSASSFALCTCTDLVSHAPLSVDAFAGTLAHAASRPPRLGINGDLTLSDRSGIDAEILVGGRSEIADGAAGRAPVEAERPPCSCARSALLDIASLVRARASDNDNASAGISSGQLDGYRGAQTLELDCGRYYFTRFKSEDPLHIRARGNVAIFVDANIELNDSLSVQSEGDSQLSLFVAGDMHVGGSLSLGGDPNGKARSDLYLASVGTLSIAGSTEITGKLYAPRAELVTTGTMQIYGSMFVRRAAPGAALYLHYDESAALPVRCIP
jgi:hypothetical protein